MKETNKLSFVEKTKLVKDACQIYKRYKMMNINTNPDRTSVNKLKEKLAEVKNIKFLSIFDQVLNLLIPTSYLIIYNDYIAENKRGNWRDLYFSKTTYYKRKHEAVDEFINCMYGI